MTLHFSCILDSIRGSYPVRSVCGLVGEHLSKQLDHAEIIAVIPAEILEHDGDVH